MLLVDHCLEEQAMVKSDSQILTYCSHRSNIFNICFFTVRQLKKLNLFTVQKLKRKNGISEDKKSIPTKTCRTNTADVSEVNTHSQNIMSTSSHPDSAAKPTYRVPSPPEYSDDGIQSNTNNIENNSNDQSMLNTPPARQPSDLVLEKVKTSSANILQGCHTRKTGLHEDGKHLWPCCGKLLYQPMFLNCSQQLKDLR